MGASYGCAVCTLDIVSRLADPLGTILMAFAIRVVLPATGSVSVSATGELDLATKPELTDALARAMDMHPHVVVDLAEVTFMDASVIGVLISSRRQALARGGSLVVVSASPWITKVLHASGAAAVLVRAS